MAAHDGPLAARAPAVDRMIMPGEVIAADFSRVALQPFREELAKLGGIALFIQIGP